MENIPSDQARLILPINPQDIELKKKIPLVSVARSTFLSYFKTEATDISSAIRGQRPNVRLDRDNSGYINLNNNQVSSFEYNAEVGSSR